MVPPWLWKPSRGPADRAQRVRRPLDLVAKALMIAEGEHFEARPQRGFLECDLPVARPYINNYVYIYIQNNNNNNSNYKSK